MKRVWLVVSVAVMSIAVASCSSSDKSATHESTSTTTTKPKTTTTTTTTTTIRIDGTDWKPAALARAKQLADQLRAAGVPCDDYTDYAFVAIAQDYTRRKLPIPAAMTQCTSAGDEDVTFEIFATPAAAKAFFDKKFDDVCKSAKKSGMSAFPGLTYVDGGSWLIEPDDSGTSARAAQILEGRANLAMCPDLPPPPSTTSP